VHEGEIDAIGIGERGAEYALPADDHHLVTPRFSASSRPRSMASSTEAATSYAGMREVAPMRDHDVVAAVERLADRVVGLAAHDHGLAKRDLAKPLEVGRQLARAACPWRPMTPFSATATTRAMCALSLTPPPRL
jgi:hypothetical protein